MSIWTLDCFVGNQLQGSIEIVISMLGFSNENFVMTDGFLSISSISSMIML